MILPSLKIRVTVGKSAMLVQMRNTDLDFIIAVNRLSFIAVHFGLS